MKDVMLADTPIEERAQILRDSCDKIVEKCYTRKFDTKETNENVLNLPMFPFRLQIWKRNWQKSGLT